MSAGETQIPSAESPPARSGVVIPRGWMVAHAATLAVIAAVTVVAGRGQWFFYDEWDFLAERAEWSLLAAHNGHLSLFPQLLTTLVKGAVGLHSYWPYLTLVIVAHLAVVHFIWRLMMRTGVQPLIALLTALVFGLISPAADNTLWAFQVGFITPVATGIAALLLAMRSNLTVPRILGIIGLLLVGVGFASTGLPMALAVIVFLAVRHGWRPAAAVTGAFAIVYGVWYLVFARGTVGSDGFGARTLGDLLVRMPEFIAHAFIDSVGKVLPFVELGTAVLVVIGIAMIVDLRRTSLQGISPTYYLVLAAVAFAVLTAYTRVGLGVENASAGRYVYIYGALFSPTIGRLLSRLVGGSRVATSIVAALLLFVAGYNAGATVQAGREQAAVEQTVNRTISAALTLDDGSEALANRTPAAAVAPTLTMGDIRAFVRRGQYTTVPFTPTDLLDARVNLLLTATQVPGAAPDPEECAPAADGWVRVDPDAQLVYAPTSGTVEVIAQEGDVRTYRAQIPISEPGVNELTGLDSSVELQLDAGALGGLCVVPKP